MRHDLLHVEVVLPDIHVEMAEPLGAEIDVLSKPDVVERPPVRVPAHGTGDPVNAVHHAPGAHHIVRKAFPALHAAVTHDDLAPGKALGHQCQPAVGLGDGIGRSEDHALVVRRLDAHVERHLARDGKAGIEVNLGRHDLGERLFQPHELLVEIGIVADVDDHHLEIGVVLRQDQRQPLLDERIVLREERDDDRHLGIGLQHGRAAVVLVAGDTAVNENIVVQLHAEHGEHGPCEGDAFPAVACQKSIEKLHTGEICAKVQNNSEFRIPKSDYFMYFCRIYEHEVYITA